MMPRAEGCFRAEGLEVDTLAVDYHGHPPRRGLTRWQPRAGPLAQSTDMMRELIGRWVYRLRGG